MSTYREVIYMINDELKLESDDSTFTKEHILYLINKYRSFLLKQKYSDIKKQMPDSNYQTVSLDIESVPAPTEGNVYLKSKLKVPFLINIGSPKVYSLNYYAGEITFIHRDRMKYTGYNKFLQDIIYCSIGPDNYLHFKSMNKTLQYITKAKFTAIFQDAILASELKFEDGDTDFIEDVYDRVIPLEDSLIPVLIGIVVKELSGSLYTPKDETNNSKDDLSNLTVKK